MDEVAQVSFESSALDRCKFERLSMLRKITLVLVCPSFRKQCGVGRYTLQLAEVLAPYFSSVVLCATAFEASHNEFVISGSALVIFQHEYSLVDFNSSLSENETTFDVISTLRSISDTTDSKVALIMHTVADDHPWLDLANKQILAGQIPIFSTTRGGASHLRINHIELGVPLHHVGLVEDLSSVNKRNHKFKKSQKSEILVCSFGFLSDNKDVRSVLRLCANSGAKIHANFASTNKVKQAEILEEAEELGVSGRITFDFLDDHDLINFISEADIVYLPQHDFKHFSTSATARLGLATGKLVIVPPYSPFHDLAAAVLFADLDHATATVARLVKEPYLIEKMGCPGRVFADQAEMGRVYIEAASLILENKVWCGGSAARVQFDSSVAQSNRELRELPSISDLSPQNAAGIEKIGLGFARGEILEKGSFVRFGGEASSVLHRPGLDTFDHVIDIENDFQSCGTLEKISAWLQSTIQTGLGTYRLRAVRGLPSTYFSVMELLGLPSFCQALFMVEELSIPVDKVAGFCISHRPALNQNFDTDDFLNMDLFSKLISLRDITKFVPLVKKSLFWGRPLMPAPSDMRKFIFPESILVHDDGECVRALYSLLLRRNVDAIGFWHHVDLLRKGLRKCDLAWEIANSPEALAFGVKLAYDRLYWSKAQSQMDQRSKLYAAMTPAADINRDRNLSYRENMIVDRAKAELHFD